VTPTTKNDNEGGKKKEKRIEGGRVEESSKWKKK